MGKKIDVEQLIGPEEVAAVIGLTNPRGVSVYRRRPGFPGPAVDKGRCVLWLRSDIETWNLARTTVDRATSSERVPDSSRPLRA